MTLDLVDNGSQEKTQFQYMRLISPQRDNTKRGPHFMLMAEQPTGPGTLYLRAGGNLIQSSCDNSVEFVGYEQKDGKFVDNPASKITFVSDKKYEQIKDYSYTGANRVIYNAQRDIILLSGRDYDLPKDKNGKPQGKGPGCFPVVVFVPGSNGGGVLKISDRIFASCSPQAPTVSIYNMRPYVNPR